MMGMDITLIDWLSIGIAIVITVYVSVATNPNEPESNAHSSLRICRVGLALVAWSFGFGLIGFALALAAFVLGIIGIVKGRALYGVMLIIGSVVVPILGLFL